MEEFEVEERLLNAQFEGYKLRSKDEESTFFSFPLEKEIGTFKPLTTNYNLLYVHAIFNHLYPDPYNENIVFYFTKELSLFVLKYEKNDEVFQKELLKLNQPSNEVMETIPENEFSNPIVPPSICFSSINTFLVSNGRQISIFNISDNREMVELQYVWNNKDTDNCGSILLSSKQFNERNEILCLFSYPQNIKSATTRETESLFEVQLISFRYESPLKIESAVVLASLKGKHFSFLSNIVNNGEEFFVSGEYTSFDHDVNMNKEETQDENQNEIKYFWQQTSDQVTISIPLPSTIQKSEIKCSFTNNSIMVTEKNNILEGKLHSRIIPMESIWTIEQVKTGFLLTLHLEKEREDKWIQVFEVDDGVLEIVDPSELSSVIEKLEKLTSNENLQTPQVSSLLGIEECDEAGEAFSLQSFSRDGKSIKKIHTNQELLSVSRSCGNKLTNPTLALKFGVDCVIYSINDQLKTVHTASFNAFGFVQASKKEKKFMIYGNQYNFISIIDHSRYIYIYKHGENENVSDQFIFDSSLDEVHGVCELSNNHLGILTNNYFHLIKIPQNTK